MEYSQMDGGLSHKKNYLLHEKKPNNDQNHVYAIMAPAWTHCLQGLGSDYGTGW